MGSTSNYDMVVFDMEDALVDRSLSECAAVSHAIDAYLTALVGVRPEGGPVFRPEEVRAFMEGNGFDADVDVLHALLAAALHTMADEIPESAGDGYDGREMLEAVAKSGLVKDSLGDLAKHKNMNEFSKLLKQKGGGRRALPRVRGLRNRWLILAEGHMLMDNFVKRMLAEAFLGDDLFHKEYGQKRQFVTEPGTIDLEKGWMPPRVVEDIRARCGGLATLTIRTQTEAQYVLDRIGVGGFVDVVVSASSMGMGMASEEEVTMIRTLGVGGGVGADYPTRVTEAIERVRAQEGIDTVVRVAYVGNCAAEARGIGSLKDRYRLTAIGCAFGQDQKAAQAQRDKGADIVVTEPDHLLRVLSERPRMRNTTDYNRY